MFGKMHRGGKSLRPHHLSFQWQSLLDIKALGIFGTGGVIADADPYIDMGVDTGTHWRRVSASSSRPVGECQA